MQRIYLDYNASTPIDSAVAAAMRLFLEDHYGNPSSRHWASVEAKAAIDTDAAQSVGKISTDVNELGIDLLSIAGHKVYAAKGVGALFVRRGVRLEPLIHGAAHEAGRRAGTESAFLAVGLGKACELARDLAPMDRVRALRDHFWQELQQGFGN